jgi:hypothetical protein
MKHKTIRRRIAACGVVAMISTALASPAGAQSENSGSTGAAWGAEGRIGSGTTVYLTRWFNNDWSVLAGGSFAIANQKNDATSTSIKSNFHQAEISTLARRSWGAGSVRPFLAFGPRVIFGSSKASGSSGGGLISSNSTQRGYGGRGEFGALIPVSSSVLLGLSSGVSVGRSTNKNSAFVDPQQKSTTTSADFGNLQFIVAFKF